MSASMGVPGLIPGKTSARRGSIRVFALNAPGGSIDRVADKPSGPPRSFTDPCWPSNRAVKGPIAPPFFNRVAFRSINSPRIEASCPRSTSRISPAVCSCPATPARGPSSISAGSELRRVSISIDPRSKDSEDGPRADKCRTPSTTDCSLLQRNVTSTPGRTIVTPRIDHASAPDRLPRRLRPPHRPCHNVPVRVSHVEDDGRAHRITEAGSQTSIPTSRPAVARPMIHPRRITSLTFEVPCRRRPARQHWRSARLVESRPRRLQDLRAFRLSNRTIRQ